jgi:hypothetical protein
VKILDGLKRILPRTHYHDFSTAAFQNGIQQFPGVRIIIYCDYLYFSKSAIGHRFSFIGDVLCRTLSASTGFGGYGSQPYLHQ